MTSLIPFVGFTGDYLSSAFFLFGIVFGPFILFAFVIHLLEQTIQRVLAERFGWKSVMWTGWLGTPIHELSHVVMCHLFRHRVDEVALFEPDPASGRLGFVRHSWRKGNWFEELGTVFIGIAPLIGGSVALCLLLWLFYPLATESAFLPTENSSGSVNAIMSSVTAIFSQILNLDNFLSLKFWVFVYLALCIASHMAPSKSDYQGAKKTSVFIVFVTALAGCLLATSSSDPRAVAETTIQLLSPLFAILMISVLLCLLATVAVTLIVSRFPKRYTVR